MLTALARAFARSEFAALPPADPMPLLLEWSADAQMSGRYDDSNAMVLATSTPTGAPSARVVLCKAIEPEPPSLVFYTSYASRKGRELEANPLAAAVFHWPHAKRQARIEGRVERVSAAESEAYFRTRPLLSQIGAAASRQSEELESRDALLQAAIAIAGRSALTGRVERPDSWGGFRLHAARIELWSGREGRLHDRVAWEREDGRAGIAWRARRLSP